MCLQFPVAHKIQAYVELQISGRNLKGLCYVNSQALSSLSGFLLLAFPSSFTHSPEGEIHPKAGELMSAAVCGTALLARAY